MIYDAAVIGGGAAGCMAAICAGERGLKTVLLESNEKIGRKIVITGKGRCNLTNDSPIDAHIKNTVRNPRFMYRSLNKLSPQDLIRFFESAGVKIKTERGNRVFPVSDRSTDIVDALYMKVKAACEIRFSFRVSSVRKDGGVFTVASNDKGEIKAYNVIVATGGRSYPLTGSTGDGYAVARSFGHNVITPAPSLVPIDCADADVRLLARLTLKNVTLSLYKNGKSKPVYSELGEMLFTHTGISGPLALSASCHIDAPCEDYAIYIDLKPGLSDSQLGERILRDFDKYKNKDFRNSLSDLLPSSLIPVVVARSGVDGAVKVNSVTREQREKLINIIKRFALTPRKLGSFDEAVVTRGGVDVKEIDPSSMQSKLVQGLYFAGEVIDCDAYTGGFNLQIAFSTGYNAGMSVQKHSKEKKTMIIAIDGPSGAGKSTLSDALAKKIGFIHIDTGAMYRAIGVFADDHGVDTTDAEKVTGLLPLLTVGVDFKDGAQHVYNNGEDVTKRIREPQVSMFASNVSKIPAVRTYLVNEQRRIAGEMNILMDGRDIGTVVFPNADLKIYLTASAEDRARRRYEEQLEKGFDVSFDDVLADVIKRDEQDMNRDLAPLRPADDAVIVDSSGFEFEETFKILLDIVNKRFFSEA